MATKQNAITLAGFKAATGYAQANVASLVAWTEGAQFCRSKKLADDGLAQFFSGYKLGLIKAGMPEKQTVVRASEYKAIVRAAMLKPVEFDKLYAEGRSNGMARGGFLTACRELAPATGQGERGPKDKTQSATKRVTTAIKAMHEAIPAASQAQALEVSAAAAGQFIAQAQTPVAKLVAATGFARSILATVLPHAADGFEKVGLATLMQNLAEYADRVQGKGGKTEAQERAIALAAQDLAASASTLGDALIGLPASKQKPQAAAGKGRPRKQA